MQESGEIVIVEESMGFVVLWARMWSIELNTRVIIKSYVHFGKLYVEKLRIRCTKRNVGLGKC